MLPLWPLALVAVALYAWAKPSVVASALDVLGAPESTSDYPADITPVETSEEVDIMPPSRSPSDTATGYAHGRPFIVDLVEVQPGQYLERDTAFAWQDMQAAAHDDGVELLINNAFRTMEEQTRLWEDLVTKRRTSPVAKPGYSNHQGGYAVDVANCANKLSAAYAWLQVNAVKFGFANTVPSEPWHWSTRAG